MFIVPNRFIVIDLDVIFFFKNDDPIKLVFVRLFFLREKKCKSILIEQKNNVNGLTF